MVESVEAFTLKQLRQRQFEGNALEPIDVQPLWVQIGRISPL
jgi:hypothetical protein